VGLGSGNRYRPRSTRGRKVPSHPRSTEMGEKDAHLGPLGEDQRKKHKIIQGPKRANVEECHIKSE